jgi:hypothetical protein
MAELFLTTIADRSVTFVLARGWQELPFKYGGEPHAASAAALEFYLLFTCESFWKLYGSSGD